MYKEDTHKILTECKAMFNELKQEVFIYCINDGMLITSEKILNQPIENIRIYHKIQQKF